MPTLDFDPNQSLSPQFLLRKVGTSSISADSVATFCTSFPDQLLQIDLSLNRLILELSISGQSEKGKGFSSLLKVNKQKGLIESI